MEHIRLTAGGVLQVQATRREHPKFKRLMLLRSSCKGRMLGDRSKPVQNHVISTKDDEASCIVSFIIHTHGHVPDQPTISQHTRCHLIRPPQRLTSNPPNLPVPEDLSPSIRCSHKTLPRTRPMLSSSEALVPGMDLHERRKTWSAERGK